MGILKGLTPVERKRLLKAISQDQLERGRFERETFFDSRTIDALIACGIYDPKSLLRMTEKQIAAIPGVGKISLSIIVAYRNRNRL